MEDAVGGVAMEEVSSVDVFEIFVQREYQSVKALVIALYGGHDPDDVVQEAFLRAQKQWSSVGGMDRPDLWVRRVAINLALSRFRRLRSESKAVFKVAARREARVVVLSAGSAEVWEAVRRLPARQAQVVALRYVEDLSVAEAAEVLGIAEGTVRALLYQARTRLSRCLASGVEVSVEEDLW